MDNVWILCNPRTGSSFLCELLNNLNLFQPYNNENLTNKKGPLEKGRAFDEWLRLFYKEKLTAENAPKTCKCIFHQYQDTINTKISYLNDIIPNLNIILLKRKNIINHIVSLYCSKIMFKTLDRNFKESSAYHIYNKEDLIKYQAIKIPINYKYLFECLLEVKSYKNNWDKYLENYPHITIYYEDIIKNKYNEIKNILNYCKLKYKNKDILHSIERTTNNPRVYRMEHQDKNLIKNILINSIL